MYQLRVEYTDKLGRIRAMSNVQTTMELCFATATIYCEKSRALGDAIQSVTVKPLVTREGA